jgi:aldehyde dehydrogenase (NAD+)/betaine-aldehyde dehydrogenase
MGTKADVDRAVEAAEAAWPGWAALTPMERAETMNRFADAIASRADEILRVEVTDTGNTIRPMRIIDVPTAVESLRYYAGLAPDLRGDTIPATRDHLHLTIPEPYGVVARIAPFNHPVMFAVARTAAALAAGNAVIVKPPETSPLSAMILAEIAKETLPPGVFNIVTGDGLGAGDAIVRHPGIKRIAFIGSPVTGRAIQRAAAEVTVKHISLELGGTNPMIVFPDCDPDKVAAAAVQGMNFSWQGQSCGSLSRLLLHEDIHDRVLDVLVERVSALKIGDPRAPSGVTFSAYRCSSSLEYRSSGAPGHDRQLLWYATSRHRTGMGFPNRRRSGSGCRGTEQASRSQLCHRTLQFQRLLRQHGCARPAASARSGSVLTRAIRRPSATANMP